MIKMEIKNTEYKKGKKFPSLSSMGNPYRHFHQKNIDNILYNKERLKKIRRAVIKGVGGVIIIGGATLAFASAFPGESIKVPEGLTLPQIAEGYGIKQSRLEELNNLEDPHYIKTGQDLIIYDKGLKGFVQKLRID